MTNRTFLVNSGIKSIWPLFALLLVISLNGCVQKQTLPLANQGYMNLSNWDFDRNGPVRLDGQWEFYWGKLLTPEDFQKELSHKSKGYIHIPAIWRGNYINSTPLPSHGYATYRLIINGLSTDKSNALYISDVLSVGTIWVNGERLAASGQIGQNKLSEHPGKHTIIARFSGAAYRQEIVLQVSNFHNAEGGINTPLWFGPDKQIQQIITKKLILTGVMGGALLIMGLYHLALFWMRREENANLYFALYCILWSLQIMFGVNGGCLMATLFPSLPWRLSIDLTLLPYGFTTPLLVMFYHALFPKHRSALINMLYQVLGVIFVFYILITPPNAFDVMVLYFGLASFSAVLYLFAMFVIDLIKNRPNIHFLIPGYLILILTIANDLLYDLHIIDTAFLIKYGAFAFIISYSLLISARFSKAFLAIKNLTRELQSQNRELSKLDHLKDELLANTSHELKTPLNGIMGMAQSLMDSSGNPRVTKGLSLIITSSIRLLHLINDLLDISKLKNKKMSLVLEPANVNSLANSVIMVLRHQTGQKPLAIDNKIPPQFPLIMANKNRLQQILFNLLGNAIKFTHRGTITVNASEQGQMAKISITDTGIGIAPENLENIFQSFTQVDQSAARNYGGTGLGLAISNDLVSLHNGQMGVTSTPGKGSVFWFTIPLYSGPTRTETTLAADPPQLTAPIISDLDIFSRSLLTVKDADQQINKQGFKIMVVDDDPVNLQVVTNHLEADNFTVLSSNSGREALACLEEGALPDLILLDVMMPEMTGYDVCRKIRQQYSASELPVIMLTAKNRIQDLVEGFSSGGNDYLTKPFFKDELMARVRTQLHLKESFQTLQENLRLKDELVIRDKRELELRLLQRQLSGMLNKIEDAVLAVNPAGEISFSNHTFETLTGYCSKELLGCSALPLFKESSNHNFKKLIHRMDLTDLPLDESVFEGISIKCADHKVLQVDISLSMLNLENEELNFLVLKKNLSEQKQTSSSTHLPEIINDLNLNKARLDRLENLLNRLTTEEQESSGTTKSEIQAVDRLLDQLEEQNLPEEMPEAKRCLAVNLMNAVCDYWTIATQTSKVELAGKSGLWNIYIEKDGWARTQTLDKYLDQEILPARPRWKNIINTVDFVLAACDKPHPLREELELSLRKFKKMM